MHDMVEDAHAAVARDSTELQRTSRELRARQQDLEDFFENGAVALHLVGSDGTILRANKAELELLGYTGDEYVGRNITEFHADAAVIQDILGCLAKGMRLDKHPARLLAKDGSIKHVLITSNVQFRHGEFVHTRCFTIDVTDWKRAEDELRERDRRSSEVLDALPPRFIQPMPKAGSRISIRPRQNSPAAGQFWAPTIGA